MKKSLTLFTLFLSFTALADGPQFNNLTKSDVENVTKEFGANFAHTVVAAPETEGLWGVEVGVMGGVTNSPDLKKVVESSGGDGSDFKKIYTGGLMARAHFPFELFAELSYLPEIKVSDVKAHNTSFGLGWNFGSFLQLPLDVAVGVSQSNGSVSFTQTTPIQSKIELDTKTTLLWAGISKRFMFFTPYLKAGVSKINGDLTSTGTILNYKVSQKENMDLSGGYLALGANVQLLFFRLGFEFSQIQGVKQVAGKLSVAF